MALRVLTAISVLAIAGCGGAPEPTIKEIAPAEVNTATITPIAITLDAVLPTKFDYAKGEATSDSQVSVFVNQTEIGTTRIDPEGVVRALVPRNLEPGPYDVRVEFSDGRTARAQAALTVVR